MNTTVSDHGQQQTSLEEIEANFNKNRGYPILELEAKLLLKRVKDGGQSGEFLAQAFLSAYGMDAFTLSLGRIIYLDAEGMRLFHQILHIRHVKGWSDDEYHRLSQQVNDILIGWGNHEPAK